MASSALQAAFEALHKKLEAEREEIQEARRQIDNAWADMRAAQARHASEVSEFDARVAQFQAEKDAMTLGKGTDVLDLNLGGEKVVAVARHTLCAIEGSMLATAFSSRWDANLTKDKEGRFFIDFPPDLFEPLIDYLRMKHLGSPSDDIPWAVNVPKSKLYFFNKMANYYGIQPPPQVCSRFKIRKMGVWGLPGDKRDNIKVSVDRSITLCGMQVYGPSSQSGTVASYEGSVVVKKCNQAALSEDVKKCNQIVLSEDVSYSLPYSADGTVGEITFTSPLVLEPDVFYSIGLQVKGPDAAFGEGGSQTIISHGVTFSFSNCDDSNGTTVKTGQIPGLIFT